MTVVYCLKLRKLFRSEVLDIQTQLAGSIRRKRFQHGCAPEQTR